MTNEIFLFYLFEQIYMMMRKTFLKAYYSNKKKKQRKSTTKVINYKVDRDSLTSVCRNQKKFDKPRKEVVPILSKRLLSPNKSSFQ